MFVLIIIIFFTFNNHIVSFRSQNETLPKKEKLCRRHPPIKILKQKECMLRFVCRGNYNGITNDIQIEIGSRVKRFLSVLTGDIGNSTLAI